ncbi:hypothetical protein L1887_47433 [Cichorium endivia]|nr:hypothetical protein L1887_47433 [Cichorium endivia]
MPLTLRLEGRSWRRREDGECFRDGGVDGQSAHTHAHTQAVMRCSRNPASGCTVACTNGRAARGRVGLYGMRAAEGSAVLCGALRCFARCSCRNHACGRGRLRRARVLVAPGSRGEDGVHAVWPHARLPSGVEGVHGLHGVVCCGGSVDSSDASATLSTCMFQRVWQRHSQNRAAGDASRLFPCSLLAARCSLLAARCTLHLPPLKLRAVMANKKKSLLAQFALRPPRSGHRGPGPEWPPIGNTSPPRSDQHLVLPVSPNPPLIVRKTQPDPKSPDLIFPFPSSSLAHTHALDLVERRHWNRIALVGQRLCRLGLAETLSVPARTLAHHHLVAAARARLARTCALGEMAVDGARMHVTLALTASTAVRVVAGVHRHTAHLGSSAQPPAPTRLAEPSVLVVLVAHRANRRTAPRRDQTHLATLQSNLRMRLSRPAAWSGRKLPGRIACVRKMPRSSDGLAPAPDSVDAADGSTAVCGAAGSVESASVESGGAIRRHLFVGDIGGARGGLIRATQTVALHGISRSQTIGRKDVALALRLLVFDQRNVRASAGIVLDAQYLLLAALPAVKVDEADAALVSTAAAAHGDVAVVVATGGGALGDGERALGLARVQMLVERLPQPADGARDGLERLELSVLAHERRRRRRRHAQPRRHARLGDLALRRLALLLHRRTTLLARALRRRRRNLDRHGRGAAVMREDDDGVNPSDELDAVVARATACSVTRPNAAPTMLVVLFRCGVDGVKGEGWNDVIASLLDRPSARAAAAWPRIGWEKIRFFPPAHKGASRAPQPTSLPHSYVISPGRLDLTNPGSGSGTSPSWSEPLHSG